jgi:hypothetical protein
MSRRKKLYIEEEEEIECSVDALFVFPMKLPLRTIITWTESRRLELFFAWIDSVQYLLRGEIQHVEWISFQYFGEVRLFEKQELGYEL